MYQYIRDVWIEPHKPDTLSFIMSELEPGVGGSFDNRVFMERYVALIDERSEAPLPVADLVSWDIRAVRTCFYSDFYGEPDWRDNWQTMWRIDARFKLPLAVQTFVEDPGTLSLGDPAVIAGLDAGAVEVMDRDAVIDCLVICRFKEQAQLSALYSALDREDFSTELKELSLAPYARTHVSFRNHDHVHFSLGQLGPKFYADGARYAQRIIQICRAHGGIENCKTLSLPQG